MGLFSHVEVSFQYEIHGIFKWVSFHFNGSLSTVLGLFSIFMGLFSHVKVSFEYDIYGICNRQHCHFCSLCCSVLRCCSVWQCVAVWCCLCTQDSRAVLQCVAVCCSMFQCVANVWQRMAACGSV